MRACIAVKKLVISPLFSILLFCSYLLNVIQHTLHAFLVLSNWVFFKDNAKYVSNNFLSVGRIKSMFNFRALLTSLLLWNVVAPLDWIIYLFHDIIGIKCNPQFCIQKWLTTRMSNKNTKQCLPNMETSLGLNPF